MPTMTASRIKSLRDAVAKSDANEKKLRQEASDIAAKIRARADGKANDEEKSRKTAITEELNTLAAARVDLDADLRNEEALQAAERGAPRSPDSPVVESVREAVASDPKRGFANFADFALAVKDAAGGSNAESAHQRLRAAAGDGMSQGVTADGGVLVPPAFSTEVWDRTRVASESMIQYCDTIPIDPGVQSVTFNAINETSRADGSRWGGVRGYWKGELTQLTESKPKFREVKIEPQELYVFAYVSDKLLRHAPGAASAVLARAAADEINFKLGDSVFNGPGAGMPRGVIGHASVVSVAKETGQAGVSVVKENIDKMWSRCHAGFRRNAVWFVNQDVEPQLEQLSAVVGTGGVPVYVPAGGIADAPNARLKGRPVVISEYCATLGTVGDIVLANFSAYCLGIRGMVDQSQSMHLKFDFAQTAFRFIFEADGQPWLASTITPYKGNNTLSPIVTLATRS